MTQGKLWANQPVPVPLLTPRYAEEFDAGYVPLVHLDADKPLHDFDNNIERKYGDAGFSK